MGSVGAVTQSHTPGLKINLGGALDLLEVHSRFLDQSQKMNGSALSQSGRMGPPNYREQSTQVYDALHMKREGGSWDTLMFRK